MRRILYASLLFLFSSCCFALAQNTVTLSGQFTGAVWGFAQIGTPPCQPGPAPTFKSCALPPMALGSAYSVTLNTIGPTTSVTCTVSTGTLPTGITLTSSGTTCVLSGTPTATSNSSFSISFTGQ